MNDTHEPAAAPSGSALSNAEDRAKASLGTSDRKIYAMVRRALLESRRDGQSCGKLLDVGCGAGELRKHVLDLVDLYIGADIIRYDGWPGDALFQTVNLDTARVDLPDGSADVVACVETIEHVENPRALVRELVRLAKPGGFVIVTTPNQLSLLSKLSLLLKNQFAAFQERPGLYPAHISALLEIDLLRIAKENNLADPVIRYTGSGRIPGTPWCWPAPLGGRALSDNILLMAGKPLEPANG